MVVAVQPVTEGAAETLRPTSATMAALKRPSPRVVRCRCGHRQNEHEARGTGAGVGHCQANTRCHCGRFVPRAVVSVGGGNYLVLAAQWAWMWRTVPTSAQATAKR